MAHGTRARTGRFPCALQALHAVDPREGPQMELTWRREQGLEQARQCWWCGHSCQGAPRGECLGPRGGSTGLSWSPGSSGLAPGPLPPVRRVSDSPLEASPHPVSQLSKGSRTEGLASSRNRMPKGSAAGRARCWATDPPLMPFRPPSPPQELVGKLLQLHFKDDKTKGSWALAGRRGQTQGPPGTGPAPWGGRGRGGGAGWGHGP